MPASPEPPTLRVAYVGRGLAGKWTSIEHVAHRAARAGTSSETDAPSRADLGTSPTPTYAPRPAPTPSCSSSTARARARARTPTTWRRSRARSRSAARRSRGWLQCTKRDVVAAPGHPAHVLPIPALAAHGAVCGAPVIASVATRGEGVWEALLEAAKRGAEMRGLGPALAARLEERAR